MSESQSPGRSVDGGVFVWFLGAGTLAAIALVISVIALFTPPSSGSGGDAAPAGSGATRTVKVELGDMYIKPATLDVAAGTKVTFQVSNVGAMEHDFKIEGTKGTAKVKPGGSATFDAGALDASTEAWCTVPGHKEAGMLMKINVTGAPAPADGAAKVATAAATTGAAATDGSAGDAKIDPNAKPAADWKPRDPTAPAPLSGTVHDVTFHMTEKVMEVAPGVKQQLWTFEDQVPGPVLRGKVGDTFNVTIVNNGSMGHSIDFHASQVSWTDEMRTIAPGESLVYTYTATNTGIFMYHCGTAPTLHHIGNGMYGAVIIDPTTLAPVAHEYVMVQSEFYLGPEGKPGDLTKMQNDKWDAVVFNGYFSQYKFSPIQVQPNERIRVWVLDAGPSENSSFHIVGTIFDTVWKEGAFLLKPDGTNGGSQAMDLQPAQGGYVEFSLAEKGFYPMVTHKFSNVGKGAIGLFRAGDAQMPAAGGH
jgi:nitrite reductase (NO-forming)